MRLASSGARIRPAKITSRNPAIRSRKARITTCGSVKCRSIPALEHLDHEEDRSPLVLGRKDRPRGRQRPPPPSRPCITCCAISAEVSFSNLTPVEHEIGLGQAAHRLDHRLLGRPGGRLGLRQRCLRDALGLRRTRASRNSARTAAASAADPPPAACRRSRRPSRRRRPSLREALFLRAMFIGVDHASVSSGSSARFGPDPAARMVAASPRGRFRTRRSG
jgi:hypothetical protein